jgi:hypothetical protein
MTRIVIAILGLLLLTGCGPALMPYITDETLVCASQPVSPADDPHTTDKDAADYITYLAEAGEDCRSKLGAVRRLLRPETK